MKVGDLVRMDFEDLSWTGGDMWGVGMIVEVNNSKKRRMDTDASDDVHVLWPTIGLSWEMTIMLEKVDESW